MSFPVSLKSLHDEVDVSESKKKSTELRLPDHTIVCKKILRTSLTDDVLFFVLSLLYHISHHFFPLSTI